ncbi:uncharacterized protein [Hetaerina americana]|uniref:uncharacterized protein n=1 Tax=Hetaerina americana TaxID=62018 RepID=UPI003A7F2BE9
MYILYISVWKKNEVGAVSGDEARGNVAVNGSCGGTPASPLSTRPDILASKPKNGMERAKRPEVLFRKSEDVVFPAAVDHTEGLNGSLQQKDPSSLPQPANLYQRTLNLTSTIAPKAQLIVEEGRSSTRRVRAWAEEKVPCHTGGGELNGSFIKEQLMSATGAHIPESCV